MQCLSTLHDPFECYFYSFFSEYLCEENVRWKCWLWGDEGEENLFFLLFIQVCGGIRQLFLCLSCNIELIKFKPGFRIGKIIYNVGVYDCFSNNCIICRWTPKFMGHWFLIWKIIFIFCSLYPEFHQTSSNMLEITCWLPHVTIATLTILWCDNCHFDYFVMWQVYLK